MPSILTSKPDLNDVVLYEAGVEWGHCRKTATVNVTAAFKVGTVVQDTINDGTYDGVAAADVATLTTRLAIVIDDAVYDGTTGDRAITLLAMPAGGYAGVKKGGLAFLDALSGPQKTTVETSLAVNKSIRTIQY